jgi:signal transduction histidine kinase
MLSSSLAMAERVDVTPEERKEMFGIAAGEASRLERLTSDFLAYARPRATQISRANVSDILAYVVSIAQARANDRGVALVVHADSTLEGDLDSAQMHQALLNLVLNAIDACGGAGPVILSASRGADGALKIDVSNPDGPIPPETAARLFEPFFTTKPGGTGLGLAIARNIARLHRGDLALSINKPGLVCFSIAIPRRDEAPHASG